MFFDLPEYADAAHTSCIETEANVVHVVPLEDLVVHNESHLCVCCPRIDVQVGGGTVVVHAALDGREQEAPRWEQVN